MNEQTQNSEQRRQSGEKEMPFLEHLEELRWRIFKSLIAMVIFSVISFVYIDQIFFWLVKPYNEALAIALEKNPGLSAQNTPHLVFLNPTGGFMIYLKLAFSVGLLASLPVIFYHLWKFIAPGLLANERRVAPLIVFFTTLCFLAGGSFCYFVVLKYGLGFLLSFQTPTLVPMISIEEYFGLVATLILVFGLVFEMPVLAYFLTRIGLLTPEFLRQKRRYGIVTIFIVAAIVTPSVDAFTQILLAAPLLVLYEISIWVSRIALPVEMKKAIKEAVAN
jgi:sec-independent protein translocase protein TatC